MRYVRSRKTPRSSGTVGWPSSRCSSAESPDSPGCTACVGCASCCGSPSRTSDFAARATATAFARENCPASSMTRTSTASARFSRHQNHDVPPTSETSPPSSRFSTSAASFDHSTPGAPQAWLSSHFCSAGRPTARSTLPITACEVAVTPTFLPASSSSRISRDAARVLPLPGGPCTASTSPSSVRPSRTTASPASSPGSRRVPAGTTRSSSACGRPGRAARASSPLPPQRAGAGRHDPVKQRLRQARPAGKDVARRRRDRRAQRLVVERALRAEAAAGRGHLGALDDQPPADGVDLLHGPDAGLGVDVERRLADRELGVLRREGELVQLAALVGAVLDRLRQAPDRGAVLDELLVLQVAAAEELPPTRAGLAAVPLHKVAEQL